MISLEGAFVPDRMIARMVPAGADMFVLALFAWGLRLRQRLHRAGAEGDRHRFALGLKAKSALAVSRSMAYHPGIQHAVAELRLALDLVAPLLDKVASDWATKGRSWRRVASPDRFGHDHAVDTSPAWLISPWSCPAAAECSAAPNPRIFEDSRCGRFHPANTFSTRDRGENHARDRSGTSSLAGVDDGSPAGGLVDPTGCRWSSLHSIAFETQKGRCSAAAGFRLVRLAPIATE